MIPKSGTSSAAWHHVSAELTDEGLVYYPPICDPWYWWCYPGGVGVGTFIVGSRSSDEIGWNLGLGCAFRNGAYLEAKFVQIQTGNKNSE